MKQLIILLVICPILPIIGVVYLVLARLESGYNYKQKGHL